MITQIRVMKICLLVYFLGGGGRFQQNDKNKNTKRMSPWHTLDLFFQQNKGAGMP